MNLAPAEVRARSFDSWAAEYERFRPGYPTVLFDHIAERLRLTPRPRAVDLGAGTGKVARVLASRAWAVTAVEPGEAMLAELRRKAAEEAVAVETVCATAESTGLPDTSFDVALAGEAYHWFDASAALAEIGRIVRPGGGLSFFWNVIDEAFPPIQDERSLVADHGLASPDSLARPGPRPETADAIRAATHFEDATFFQVTHAWPMTGSGYLGLVRTKSHLRTAPPDVQDQFVRAFEAMLRSHGIEPDDHIEVPYVIDCWIARRRES